MNRFFIRDKRFYKKLLSIAVPIILQSSITIGINLLDTLMLGKFGEGYLSATNLSNQFFSLYQIMCMGLGGGAAVMTAQAWGRKDQEGIHKSLTIMLYLTLAIGTVFTVLTLILPGPIMRIYTDDESIVKDCIVYYKYLCFCFLLHGVSLTLTQVLRTVGKTVIPLISSIIGFITNVFFNWVLIFGHLGFPRLELEGAALGTLIARAAEFLFIGGYVFFFDKNMNYRIKNLFNTKFRDYLAPYFRYANPVLISDTLLGLGNNMVAIVMGHISKEFVAAFSITSVTQQMVNVFTSGVMFASSSMIGFTLGRGDKERAYEEGKTLLSLSVVIGIISGFVIYAIKVPVIASFNIGEETQLIADSLMNSISFMIIFRMICSVLTKGVLRGGGDTKFLMIGDVAFLWAASVPLGALAGLVLHLNAFWTYFFLNIDNILKAIWCMGRFKSKKWIHVLKR